MRHHSFIKGIVGWTDLRSSGVQARLEYYYQFQEVKGFRHIVQAEAAGFLSNTSFCHGVGLLEQYNFTYDLLIGAHQLPEALAFVKKFPKQSFVIDHLAKPFIRNRQLKPWKQDLQQIAMHENVSCKISGLATEAHWADWKSTDIMPYLDTALEAFGPQRLLYGSDWPVCLLAATYPQQISMVREFIDSLSPHEKKAIMGDNAVRFYHL
jgi:L-fuconolactonase